MQTKSKPILNSIGSIIDIFGALDSTKQILNKNDTDILLNDWKVLASDFYTSKKIMKVN